MKKLLRVYSRQSRLKPGAVLCCASPYVLQNGVGITESIATRNSEKTQLTLRLVCRGTFFVAESAVTPVTLELMRFRWRSRGVDAAADLGVARVSHSPILLSGTTDHRSYQLQYISSNPSVYLEQVFNLTVGRILRSRDSSEAKSYLHTKASRGKSCVLSITWASGGVASGML